MSNKIPEDIGCNNSKCKEKNNCKRNFIAREKIAKEIKSFGGTEEKGCGKFLQLKQ